MSCYFPKLQLFLLVLFAADVYLQINIFKDKDFNYCNVFSCGWYSTNLQWRNGWRLASDACNSFLSVILLNKWSTSELFMIFFFFFLMLHSTTLQLLYKLQAPVFEMASIISVFVIGTDINWSITSKAGFYSSLIPKYSKELHVLS